MERYFTVLRIDQEPGSMVDPYKHLLKYFLPPSTFALANLHSSQPIKARKR